MRKGKDKGKKFCVCVCGGEIMIYICKLTEKITKKIDFNTQLMNSISKENTLLVNVQWKHIQSSAGGCTIRQMEQGIQQAKGGGSYSPTRNDLIIYRGTLLLTNYRNVGTFITFQ